MSENEFIADSFSESDGEEDAVVNFLEGDLKSVYEEIEHTTARTGKGHILNIDELATYIYPVNFSIRQYQFDIVKKCFFENVICAIPTGTGKTFISSCVMMNYYKWFKTAKIVFVAPTRPLVAQQIKAAVGCTGIPSDNVAVLLDKSRKNRPEIWASKRVIFSTPQVVENDLKAGFCDPKSVCLLVIDEAHRTRGNYAYNNIIKFINRFTPSIRILALTATPGADIISVQEVIDNLLASSIEIRTEDSPDLKRYMKQKHIDQRVLEMNDDINDIIVRVAGAAEDALKIANKHKVYEETDAAKINGFQAMQASQKVINNPKYPEGLKWHLYFVLQLLTYVGQMLRSVKTYGVKTFYLYLQQKYVEFTTKYEMGKSTNKIAAGFYGADMLKSILPDYRDKVDDPMYLGHPKIELLVDELTSFYSNKSNLENSRVIIFTELRESALEIVKAIESVGNNDVLKAHIFIGQSREKEKFDEESFRQRKGKKKKETGKKKTADTDSIERTSSENAQINGMNQKQQKQLIEQFKKGEYNILVATSIGEEGLDIGEVDLIVCYDATSSPIKNIQRIGRTGRQKDGHVLLLLTDQEKSKFEKSMRAYEILQDQISSGNHFTYKRSQRLIPPEYNPACEKKYIQIDEEFANEDEEDLIIKKAIQKMNNKTSKRLSKETCIETMLLQPKKLPKRFFMPDGVDTGFKSVSAMVKKRGSKDESVSASKKRKSDIMDILELSQEDSQGGSIRNPLLVAKPSLLNTDGNDFDGKTGREKSENPQKENKQGDKRSEEQQKKGDIDFDIQSFSSFEDMEFKEDKNEESAVEDFGPTIASPPLLDSVRAALENLTSKETSTPATQEYDVRIEKVIHKPQDKDIASMIKNRIGAIGVTRNKITSNTLKGRSLGARRRKKNVDELSRLMTEQEYQKLENSKAELGKANVKDKKRVPQLEQIKPDDRVYTMKFGSRSGYISNSQEAELYEKNENITNFVLGDPAKAVWVSTGRIDHSKHGRRLLDHIKSSDYKKTQNINHKLLETAIDNLLLSSCECIVED